MIEEATARKANSTKIWDRLWKKEGNDTWRQHALKEIYDRIEQLSPKGSIAADLGGGVGILADRLKKNKEVDITVCDHSFIALEFALQKGLTVCTLDLENDKSTDILSVNFPSCNLVIATEALEHLSANTQNRILSWAAERDNALISVPNDRLGPDTEKQHTVKFTAIEFKRKLLEYFEHARVEVYGGYLLGVCGTIAKKDRTLSVTFPARDEAVAIEKTLASFRGVADQMVIGIDPRTTDNTKEIAEKYADEVFFLESPQGPPDEYQGDDGIHFSWCRNQCIDKCTSDWIFMTEAHEYLNTGQEILLNLEKVLPEKCRAALVARESNRQRWAFPWLFQCTPDIKFTRPVHNILDLPEKTFIVRLPQIATRHERDTDKAQVRYDQRKSQNRKTLYDDWLSRHSTHSLFYLAQEWRGKDPRRCKEFFERFIATSNNGGQKYQARLIVAREYMLADEKDKSREVLIGAVADDWSRTEHWVWLGDLAYDADKFEEAYMFYTYATVRIGNPPFTLWWIDLHTYSYIPAQRMALVCAQLGKLPEGRAWARKVLELLPEDAPDDVIEEAKKNIELFDQAIGDTDTKEDDNAIA